MSGRRTESRNAGNGSEKIESPVTCFRHLMQSLEIGDQFPLQPLQSPLNQQGQYENWPFRLQKGQMVADRVDKSVAAEVV